MSDFGIFAQDLRLKVTNEVKQAGRILIIPCQMGFKQKDGSWVNDWLDVVVFEGDNYEKAKSIGKGDKITVSGRMTMKEYNQKKSWQVLCSELEVAENGQTNQQQDAPLGEVPF